MRQHKRAQVAVGDLRVEKMREDEPDDHALGRSRGRWRPKLHIVVDGRRVALTACVFAGQAHESKQFEQRIKEARPPRREGWPRQPGGDKSTAIPGGVGGSRAAVSRL